MTSVAVPLGLERGQARDEGRRPSRIEVRRRLVEHQHRRLRCQGTGQCQPLALATRERCSHRPSTIGQPDVVQCLGHAIPHAVQWPAARLETEGDVVLDAFHDELPIGILEDQATIAAATLQAAHRQPRDVAAKEASQTQRQGALARSARTEHQQDLARGEIEIDVLDGRSIGSGETKAVPGGLDRGRRQGVASGNAPDRRTARSIAIAANGRTMAPEIAIAMAMARTASGA